MHFYEKKGEKVPPPSASESIALKDGEFVSFVRCDTITYQRMNNTRAVKKTLSVPEWLNDMAEKAGINFSQVLQEALREKLGVA